LSQSRLTLELTPAEVKETSLLDPFNFAGS